MQGRLSHQPVSIEIETRCQHCGQALHLTLDGDLRVSVQEDEAAPLVFMPDVDWARFTEPTIRDAY